MHVEFGRVEHEENGVCLFVWLFCDLMWHALHGGTVLCTIVALTFAFSMHLCLSMCTLPTVLGEIL